MDFLKGRFTNRSLGFYFGLVASFVFLIADIAFIIIVGGSGDRTFNNLTFVCILLGVLSEVLVILTDFKFTPLLPVIFYSVGLGKHIYEAAFPVADYFTGVKFFGGNFIWAISFGAIFFICTIITVISCFMDQRKAIETL